MTSIRYYKEPHIVKLDRRFKGYNRGFRYRIDFDTQPMSRWEHWLKVVKWCESTWGKEYTWTDDSFLARRVWNDNYRTETGKNKYYRQLYLRSEQDLTMLLLVIS